MRHKLGYDPIITSTWLPGGNESNINVFLTPIHEIDWPWFRFIITRQAQEDLQFPIIPRRFGRAYVNYDLDYIAYWIIPLNVLVAGFRWLWRSIKWDFEKWLDRNYRHEFEDGVYNQAEYYEKHYALYIMQARKESYNEGWSIGYETGMFEARASTMKEAQEEAKKNG